MKQREKLREKKSKWGVRRSLFDTPPTSLFFSPSQLTKRLEEARTNCTVAHNYELSKKKNQKHEFAAREALQQTT